MDSYLQQRKACAWTSPDPLNAQGSCQAEGPGELLLNTELGPPLTRFKKDPSKPLLQKDEELRREFQDLGGTQDEEQRPFPGPGRGYLLGDWPAMRSKQIIPVGCIINMRHQQSCPANDKVSLPPLPLFLCPFFSIDFHLKKFCFCKMIPAHCKKI